MENLSQLLELIHQKSSKRDTQDLDIFRYELLSRHGKSVQAILYYGSCFRKGDINDGLIDLYLLVDNYRDAYRNPIHGLLNKLLPPNVFYLEIDIENRVLRAKYAIVSLSDFQRGTSMGCFHSYLWGRFAQPTGILFCRNESVRNFLYTTFSQAVTTFLTRVIPNIPVQFDARELWYRGMLLSYQCELRTERTEKLVRLFEWAPQYYEQLTRIGVKTLPYPVDVVTCNIFPCWEAQISPLKRFLNRSAWHLRFVQGKLLSLLRLLKAQFTFNGGIEYILWKIKRHSGISVEVPPHLSRIPLLRICYVFWKLYQNRAFR